MGSFSRGPSALAMPPKKAKTKNVEKKKAKLVEDKTFGMKNKNKSSKVQKYVQSVQKQVDYQMSGNPKKVKGKEKAEIEEFIAYKPAVAQKKVEKGVDPKSILCEFFKQGKCVRGNKCRYSHDVAVERKAAKIDIYTDARDENADNMDDWDQEKLEEVVNKKHSAHNTNKTDIVCKYFLDAVENRKYGWFWECQNGVDCKYRHALPPGYVLKKDRVKEEDTNKVDIVEEIEEERKLLKTHTPITYERFKAWKDKKDAARAAEEAERQKKRKADIKSGTVQMSGREMFMANPDMFVDDDCADDMTRAEEEDDPSVPVNIITATGTSITRTAVQRKDAESAPAAAEVADASLFGGDDAEDLDNLDE